MGAGRDEDAELALAELRDEIDSLKRQHDAERPGEGVDMQSDEDKLMEQGAAQLRGQLEEDEFDDEMDVDEHVDEDDGAADLAGADEQDLGTEEAKHQPEHIEEEKVTTSRHCPSASRRVGPAL